VPQVNSDTRTYRIDIGRDTRSYQDELVAHTWAHWKGTGPLTRLDEGDPGPEGWPYRNSVSPARPAVRASDVRLQPTGRRPLARHRKPPSRRMRRAASATAIVLAGGGAAVGLLYATGSQPVLTGTANQSGHALASSRVSTDGTATALATPAGAGTPAQAYVPRHATGSARRGVSGAAGSTGSAAATGGASLSPNTRAGAGGSASASASPSSSGSSSSASAAPSPHATSSPPPSGGVTSPSAPVSAPPSSAPSGTCADPTFTTSSAFGSETLGAYTISNDVFNAGGGGISQTLSACSAADWSVEADVSADGGVMSYPNSAYEFAAPPEISSLGSVTSTFGSTLPATGAFDDAYDIWLNGTAATGGDEVMIWTASQGQTPAGVQVATATIDGQDYAVWQQAGGPITFVSDANVSAGDLNLLPFFQWLTSNGYESTSSTLNQVAFGAQIVSTNGTQETFGFNNFSVTAS
jgi:hypothetical protein